MAITKAKKPIPRSEKLMLALLPALAVGWFAVQSVPTQKAQPEVQAGAALIVEAAQRRCLMAAGLQPNERSREVSLAEAAALAGCRSR
jgi:hypothetical protein